MPAIYIKHFFFYFSSLILFASAFILLSHPSGFDYYIFRNQYYWSVSLGIIAALIACMRPRWGFGLVGSAMLFPLGMMGHISSLLVVLFQWVAIASLGISLNPNQVRSFVDFIRCIVVGYVAYSLLVVVLVYSGWLDAPTLFGISAAAIIVGFWRRRDAATLSLRRRTDTPTDLPPSALTAVAIGLSAALFIILSIMAAAPENGSDAVAAYRPMIVEIMTNSALNFDPARKTIGLLSIPQIWQQAATAVLSGDIGSTKIWNYSLVCVSFAISLVMAKSVLGRSKDVSAFAILPGLLAATVPTISKITLSAFPDLGAFIAVQMLAFWIWYVIEKKQFADDTHVALACQTGALLAVVYLSKFVLASVIASIMLAGGLYLLIRYRSRSAFQFVIVTAVVALGIVLAWHAFVYAETGNPFFPYYDEIWDSPFADPMQLPMHGYFSFLLPWDMTVFSTTYSPVISFDGGLGLTFLFGSLLAIYLLVQALIRRDIEASAWISSAAFLLGTFAISWVLNNDRYVVPLLALLTMPVASIARRYESTQFLLVSLVVCALNLALLPRMGFGAGSPDLDPERSAYPQIYDSKLGRQRVADNLSRRYGGAGRFLDLSKEATPLGVTFDTSWYRTKAKSEIESYQSRGLAWVRSFIRDKKIDAVAVTQPADTETIATLSDLAKEIETSGDYLVFHIKDSVRFDRFYPAKQYGQTLAIRPVGQGTYVWQVTYRCDAPGSILLVRKDPLWRSDSNMPICDGRDQTYTSPLMTWTDGTISNIFLRGFGQGFEVIKAGIWYRSE